jgi:hypothetical protein
MKNLSARSLPFSTSFSPEVASVLVAKLSYRIFRRSFAYVDVSPMTESSKWLSSPRAWIRSRGRLVKISTYFCESIQIARLVSVWINKTVAAAVAGVSVCRLPNSTNESISAFA